MGEPLAAEAVPLDDALGRVLATDAVAPEDVPGFDNSAMDGFAVLRPTRRGPPPGRRSGSASPTSREPAHRPHGRSNPARRFGISTGGVVPDGADAVVRLEEAGERDGAIEFEVAVGPGRDIRRAGEDVRAGATVLEAGTLIGAAELGVLASLGGARALVRPATAARAGLHRRRAARPRGPMRPGGVRNSNAYTVPALARNAGAEVVSSSACPDEPEATRDALERALAADVTVVCGGVSVGEHDHVKAALAELGAEQVFWGVALRPGRPTWFGTRGGSPGAGGALVFGLPATRSRRSSPSCSSCAPPCGRSSARRRRVDSATAMLTADVPRLPRARPGGPCALELTDSGWPATPTGPQGSHVLTSMLDADALAVVEAGPEPARAGDASRSSCLRV